MPGILRSQKQRNTQLSVPTNFSPNGLAIAPPGYGIDSVDESIQRVQAFSGPPKATPPNQTGLPDQLKAGVESLSEISMDDVRVHYNSSKPAAINALAYAQGNEIHLGPGQDKHLPHEAWHVVQQAKGLVKPTRRLTGGVLLNDDQRLENEASVMGEKALQRRARDHISNVLSDGIGPNVKNREAVGTRDLYKSSGNISDLEVVQAYSDDEQQILNEAAKKFFEFVSSLFQVANESNGIGHLRSAINGRWRGAVEKLASVLGPNDIIVQNLQEFGEICLEFEYSSADEETLRAADLWRRRESHRGQLEHYPEEAKREYGKVKGALKTNPLALNNIKRKTEESVSGWNDKYLEYQIDLDMEVEFEVRSVYGKELDQYENSWAQMRALVPNFDPGSFMALMTNIKACLVDPGIRSALRNATYLSDDKKRAMAEEVEKTRIQFERLRNQRNLE